MDADGCHAPEDLPRCSRRDGPGADVVLGSRYVPGGQVVNWPAYRNWISPGRQPVLAARAGRAIRDITGGYRAFRREVLEALTLDEVDSQGYCFQIDLAWRALQAGFRVVEVPITFIERERGASKMSNAIVAEALWKVTQWGVERRWRRRRWGAPAVGRHYPTKGRSTGPSALSPDKARCLHRKRTGPPTSAPSSVRRSRRDARRAARGAR